MSEAPKLQIVVNDIPSCPTCSQRMRWLHYREIPDGVSAILTEFSWWCDTDGRGEDAQLPDLYVDTRIPSEDQIEVHQLADTRAN